MSRIRHAFENRFRALLGELGARQREKGVRSLMAKADHNPGGIAGLSRGLAFQNVKLTEKVHRFKARRGETSNSVPPRIICDAGLGGLARWLRAIGCDAEWIQDISDDQLIAEAERLNAIIITTDTPLLDRRVFHEGRVKALWVPPTLKVLEQLRLVRAELNLSPLESRCMRCGGELAEVPKESVADRIPPKTYKWINQYFQCVRCGKLFWHGTHWNRIARELEKTAG